MRPAHLALHVSPNQDRQQQSACMCQRPMNSRSTFNQTTALLLLTGRFPLMTHAGPQTTFRKQMDGSDPAVEVAAAVERL